MLPGDAGVLGWIRESWLSGVMGKSSVKTNPASQHAFKPRKNSPHDKATPDRDQTQSRYCQSSNRPPHGSVKSAQDMCWHTEMKMNIFRMYSRYRKHHSPQPPRTPTCTKQGYITACIRMPRIQIHTNCSKARKRGRILETRTARAIDHAPPQSWPQTLRSSLKLP